MSKMIEILQEEHRNISRLLNVLEQELKVFDRRERPDYEIFQAIIQYFQEFPDRCHHPKEDVVFEILKQRSPAVTAAVGDIQSDHRLEAERLRRFSQMVDDILADQEIPRQTVHIAAEDFIDHQRRHMAKEENLLFPAALDTLTPADWAKIDARVDDRKDPMFDGAVESRFQNLYSTILRWEKETEEQRLKMSPAQG
ncbi:hemerythrin-like domain-containing protein [Rhodopseudomonas rhenobacensis]|uniref:Hemerythrin-like domain-containing protein n=1 Tax=Rhodopseudomonas rhenobacensis TaxID=87461 RepID=A0A7W8DZ06_9BRAD|nr:hemerythrin domain-containing protein [Rhodopseudomonas rhenobacensis]MBB5047390.1 hemerythrin-like domain-containing protein [Rhodopseudomonas rhenobacensis]